MYFDKYIKSHKLTWRCVWGDRLRFSGPCRIHGDTCACCLRSSVSVVLFARFRTSSPGGVYGGLTSRWVLVARSRVRALVLWSQPCSAQLPCGLEDENLITIIARFSR